MANCSELFSDFNSIIRLNDSKRDSLRTSRNSLRTKITNYIHDNKGKHIKLEFHGQGSFITDTVVEPIPVVVEEDGEEVTKLKYDIDDGVYFLPIDEERKSIETYHNWIVEAVGGHTNTPPIDKNTCVRVIFADGHNIDIPIYYDTDDPELAHKSKGWLQSDPLEFKDWFDDKVKDKPQLKRIVRYLKAWADYRNYSKPDKTMPSGFILTILACDKNNYYVHERDDIAFKETLVAIREQLQFNFSCYRPTTPTNDDLLAEYNHKEYFMERLDKLIEAATAAFVEDNQKKACEKWQQEFGERFPCHNAKDESEHDATRAFVASKASTSRPWSRP